MPESNPIFVIPGVMLLSLGGLMLFAWGVSGSGGIFIPAIGVALAIGGLLLLAGGRGSLLQGPSRGPSARDEPASPSDGQGPVPVPPEEMEMLEMPVRACLECGSADVESPTISDGFAGGGGELTAWVCRRCGWRGQPITFDSPTGYREFVKALHENDAD